MSVRRSGILLLLVVAAAAAAWWVWERAIAVPDLSRWDTVVAAAAREFDLDPNLLRGLMAAESGGDPEAVSHAGAVGLLQLMPATAKAEAERLRIENYEPARLTEGALNVRLGASYLSRMLQRFGGKEPFALAAYNAGPSRVIRWRGEAAPGLRPQQVIEQHGFKETRNHMRRVLRFREVYEERYKQP